MTHWKSYSGNFSQDCSEPSSLNRYVKSISKDDYYSLVIGSKNSYTGVCKRQCSICKKLKANVSKECVCKNCNEYIFMK